MAQVSAVYININKYVKKNPTVKINLKKKNALQLPSSKPPKLSSSSDLVPIIFALLQSCCFYVFISVHQMLISGLDFNYEDLVFIFSCLLVYQLNPLGV